MKKIFLNILLAFAINLHAAMLINCTEGSPSTFNPQLAIDATTFNASSIPIYNRLFRYELGSTKLIPSLAESYQISKDGKTYTIKLKKNINFHSNKNFTPHRNFNADDVLFSFNRQRLKDHPYHNIGGGNYPQYQNNIGDNITDIIAINPYEIKITLKNPTGPFLNFLAGQYMSILSAEYASFLEKRNEKEKFDLEPIGTGPFVFKSYSKDQNIKFTSFKKQDIDQLFFAITPDQSVRYQKLKAKECDFITLPGISDIGEMKKNNKITVLEQEGLNIGYLAFNSQKPPFNNPKIRQAFSMIFNRQLYLDAIYQNTGTIAKGPLPPKLNYAGYDYKYNPTLAKKMLVDLKFDFSKEIDLLSLPVTRAYNPDGKKMAELMQADLSKLGIKLKIYQYDWPTFLKKGRGGEHSLIQFGWTGNADPDSFLYDLLSCSAVESGNNMARWCDKEFDSLVTKARMTTDEKLRKAYYQKAIAIFNKEMPWLPIANGKVFRAMNNSVKNYLIDPFGYDYFESVKN